MPVVSPFPSHIQMDPYLPAVNTWNANVIAAGGAAPSADTKSTLNGFYAALTNYNLLSKLKVVNCYVPDNLIACSTPLIYTNSVCPWVNHGWVAGDLTVNGLKGATDYWNKYWDLGAISAPSNWSTMYDVGASCYLTEPSVIWGANEAVFGAALADNNDSRLSFNLNLQGVTASYCWYAFGGYYSISNGCVYWNNGSDIFGFFCFNRGPTAGQARTLAFGNSANTFAVKVTTTGDGEGGKPGIPNNNMYVQGEHFGGRVNKTTGQRVSFIAFHTMLTFSEQQSLYSAVQSMRQQLGGGYI